MIAAPEIQNVKAERRQEEVWKIRMVSGAAIEIPRREHPGYPLGRFMKRTVAMVMGALAVWLTQPNYVRAQASPTPEEVARKLGFDDSEIKKIRHGEFVRKGLKEGSAEELAGVVAGFFPQPASQLADGALTGQFLDPNDPTSQFHVWNPDASTNDEFSGIALSAKETQELKIFSRAKAGDKLNLSAVEIEQFKKAGNDLVAVNTVLRTMLKTRYEAYRRDGLKGIAPYVRGKDESVSAGAELQLAINETMGIVPRQDFFQALLAYPADPLPGVEHRFYWYKQIVEDRPMFVLEHRVGFKPDSTMAIVIEEQYYVGHTYNANFIADLYLADPDGTFVFCINRTFTGQVAGFGSSLKHAIGRKQMLSELVTGLHTIRGKLKQSPPPIKTNPERKD